jgi:hypothetical protein
LYRFSLCQVKRAVGGFTFPGDTHTPRLPQHAATLGGIYDWFTEGFDARDLQTANIVNASGPDRRGLRPKGSC